MYEYIKGDITSISPTYLVIEAFGVGYRAHISLSTFTVFQNRKQGKIFIHQVIKEDSNELFGFAEEGERSLFLLLISVSGVGAATALMMLSAMGIREIKEAIASSDAPTLQAIKGIGAKTAQRIIIDLKDKILKLDSDITLDAKTATPMSVEKQEALAALQMLGFKKNLVEKTVGKILKETPSASVEEIIKLSLKQL